MIRGYVSSDEDDEDYFGYSEPLKVSKNSSKPLPPIQTKDLRDELLSVVEDSKKISLYMKAVAEGDFDAIIQILDSGLHVDATAPDEWTALMKACQMGDFEVVWFLLGLGSDPNLHKELFTPLMACCNFVLPDVNSNTQCVRALLEHGADVNMKDKYRTTALMYAVSNGYSEIVDGLLLVPEIDLNIQDKEGWTALFHAVYHNKVDMVKKLVAAGCDQTLKDRLERTAFNLAEDKEYKEIAAILGNVEDTDLPKFNPEEHSTINLLKELPSSNGDGGFPADAQFILSLFNEARTKNISLPDLLNVTDKGLYEIGVKLEYNRRKILKKIHEYHLFPWKKSAMFEILSGQSMNMEDAIAITGNLAKHLTVAKASLRYLDTRLSSRLNKGLIDRGIERELITFLVNSYVAVNKIRNTLKRITCYVNKIGPNCPGDYIYPEKKNHISIGKYLWSALSASTAGYLIYYLKTQVLKL